MPQDPFPQTSDSVMEHRLSVVFSSLSTIDVLPDDPSKPRQGQMWLNKNTGKLRVFLNGRTYNLSMED